RWMPGHRSMAASSTAASESHSEPSRIWDRCQEFGFDRDQEPVITFESRRFDTGPRVQHPTSVVRLSRRLAAVAAVLTLCAGNLAVCAGWQATPEERMTCCQDEATCPMHKSESRGAGSKRAISQVQADSCCAAASTYTQSLTSNPTFVLVNATALPVSATLVVPAAVPAL